MPSILPFILQPGVVNEVFSRIRVINNRLQGFFSGTARKPVSGRHFGWDIFDETRDIAEARAPGTGPSIVAPNPVGHVTGQFPRYHETVRMLFEELHNLRKIGGPIPTLDLNGETYIANQMQILMQKFTNAREFMYSALIRGSYIYTRTGDSIKVDYDPGGVLTGGKVRVDFGVPDGNKGSLDMLGTGNLIAAAWSNPATDIPAHLFAIDAAYEQLTGRKLRHIWLNSKTMAYLLNNDKIKALAGSANVVWDTFERIEASNDFLLTLKGMPMFVFHVTNGGLNVNGAFTKLLPDNRFFGCPDPDSSWVETYEGSEVVLDTPESSPVERFGTYFWANGISKPAGWELNGLMNMIPALKIRKAVVYATLS